MSAETRQIEQGIADAFDRAAATYDRPGPRHFSHFGERLVAHARLAAGAIVLDVAAGRGAVTFPAAKRVGPRGRVIGIDKSEDMLREMAVDMQGAEWGNIELRQMDAEQLLLPDASFDWVLCGFALWFFPHPDRALQEFYRVLQPGGRLGLTTWAADSPHHSLGRPMLRSHFPASCGIAGSAEARRFDTKGQLEEAVLKAGFGAPEIIAEEREFIYATEELLWQQLWSAGLRGHLERMTAVGLERAKADYCQELQALRQEDGIHVAYRALFTFAFRP